MNAASAGGQRLLSAAANVPADDLPPRPRLRGRFHLVAFFVAIPAGIMLVSLAHTATARMAAAVYAGSLAGLFGVSATYHHLRSPRFRSAMKRADHSMIYVLIAGTATPVSLLALPSPWSWVLLGFVWMGAAVGIALKIIRVDGFNIATGTLYIALGWATVLFTPLLLRHMSTVALGLVALGGVLYTCGAIVFRRKRPDPRPAIFGYHEVWHSFVVLASLCHYIAVMLLVIPAHPGLG